VKLQTPSDLARLVKNTRTQRNLTQQDIAAAVGITRQSVARLERGNGGTSFDTVLLILDHLGIHLNATTDRSVTAPAALATQDAAQAASEALARRIAAQTGSGALKVLNKQFLDALPPIDPSLLHRVDTTGIRKRLEVGVDPATLASIRHAFRELNERLGGGGSVDIDRPRFPGADSRACANPDPDAAGSVE